MRRPFAVGLGDDSDRSVPFCAECSRTPLRQLRYLTILFNFVMQMRRNITETVSTLAHIAKFVATVLINTHSISQELSFIVPHLLFVPIQPLILASQREYAMP